MSSISELLAQFKEVASNPRAQLDKYLKQGKKAIGCFPYYVPEELVEAAGMVPFGIWGAEGTIKAAKEYFASFYCTIAQMGLELGLTGALDGLSGVIMSSMCDTLRPLTQNFRVAVPNIPFIFLAHPQNRKIDCGVQFTISEYTGIKKKLEEIAGTEITNEKLSAAIKVYNASRAARRKFVKLAGEHPDVIKATSRSHVLKSALFMTKAEHTELLNQLNAELEKLPACDWKGTKVVTSGIIADSQKLLEIFDENNMAIVADDVAQESRGIMIDASEEGDPMLALAMQFAAQDCDPLLYDPDLTKRPAHVVDLVKKSGAQGVVVLMMQFCDPEEMEHPDLKKGLEAADIPSITIGVDQQMTDFGQARTSIQAFADVLNA